MQELQPSLMLDQQQGSLLKSNGKGGGEYLKKGNLFMYRPTAKLGKIEFCGLRYQRALLQLQSGSCKLKEHQHKLG